MRHTNRIYGIIGTVLFHALLLLALILGYMKFPPDDMAAWPPATDQLIEAEELEPLYDAGEFVRMGDDLPLPTPDDTPAPSDETVDEPSQPGTDPVNAGKPANPKPTLTQKSESPAKVKEEPKGPTKEEIAREKERQQARQQQQAKKNADDATRRAFAKKDDKGSGKAGQADGNSAAGAMEGLVGGNVAGRSLERWTSVRSTKRGRIAVRVTVDSEGRVTSATYSANGSSGDAAASTEIRNRCVEGARRCQFSRVEGSRPATGTIIYNFR